MKRAPGQFSSGETESPNLPGFRTWRAVYIFVFAFFIFCVVLLAILARAFA
jgi:hypothetical protein